MALEDSPYAYIKWDSDKALARMVKLGYHDKLTALVSDLETALAPAPHNWLVDRLTTLWALMSHEGDDRKATVWLSEMRRLLSDIPADILHEAIDKAVIESDRGFMPSIGAIRKHADPALERRKLQARRAKVLADKCKPETEDCKPENDADQVSAEEFAQFRKEMESALRANPKGGDA